MVGVTGGYDADRVILARACADALWAHEAPGEGHAARTVVHTDGRAVWLDCERAGQVAATALAPAGRTVEGHPLYVLAGHSQSAPTRQGAPGCVPAAVADTAAGLAGPEPTSPVPGPPTPDEPQRMAHAALVAKVREVAQVALPHERSRQKTMRFEINRQDAQAHRLDDLTVSQLGTILAHLEEIIRRRGGPR